MVERARDTELDARIDSILAAIDARVAALLDAILHHPSFVRLESTWRALWTLVSAIEPEDRVVVTILNASAEDLRLDFEDAPDVRRSGLYKQGYRWVSYGMGCEPYAAIVAPLELSPEPAATTLLGACAAVSSSASAPLIVSVARDWVRRLADGTASHREAEVWDALRRDPEARFVAAVATRFQVRAAYDVTTEALVYRETWASDEARPWASGAWLLARLLGESFADTRLPVGLTDRPLDGLPNAHTGDVPLSPSLDRGQRERLVASGVISFEHGPVAGALVCRDAPTLLHPEAPIPFELSPEDRALHGCLPATLFVGRMLTHLRVLRFSEIGLWANRARLEAELRERLSRWLDRDGPDRSEDSLALDQPTTQLARRPRGLLRSHSIEVDQRGPFLVLRLRFQPSWSVEGRFFTLVGEAIVEDESEAGDPTPDDRGVDEVEGT